MNKKEQLFPLHAKLHIRKDDTVLVTTGDDKGKKGRVLRVDKAAYKAVVEGINMVSRHTKPNAANPNGGIIKKEAPVHISNLMLLDPKTGKPTRIGFKKDGEKVVRVSKKSGEVIK
jgi:large subunit ribosomal protein L24